MQEITNGQIPYGLMNVEIAEGMLMCPNIPWSCDHVNHVLQHRIKDKLSALVKLTFNSASPSPIFTSVNSASTIALTSPTANNNTVDTAPNREISQANDQRHC